MPNHLLELQSMELVGKANLTRHITGLFQNLIGALKPEQLSMSSTESKVFISTILKEEFTYGILSHRWLPEGELTFQDMQPSSSPSLASASVMDKLKTLMKQGRSKAWAATTNPGLAKIVHFCKIASEQGCKYVWFDTGCINKASSAELEESIRSMFSWYQNSKLCIVHLAKTTNGLNMFQDPWFTRGWTLQELLAPKAIKFYDESWHPLTPAPNDKIPDKDLGFPLWSSIEEITSIPEEDLLTFEPGTQNIRQRMAWASKRQTTRVEDMAYCLIGIFNVPLSVAYGEGEMAFYRLQLEVMQHTDDKALFAWSGMSSVRNSMFAAAPVCFGSFILKATHTVGAPSDVDTTYALTNRGLRISLSFFEAAVKLKQGTDKYMLSTPGLGTIMVIPLQTPPKSTQLKVVLLGDISTTTSEPSSAFVILLDFDEDTKQHVRIATDKVLEIERPKKLELQQLSMFIV